jgi:hypothetical protein
MGQGDSNSSRKRALNVQRILPDVPDDLGRPTTDAQQILPELPDHISPRFRVLIIGRANAGKTSILQRVCDTTESPEIYRLGRWGNLERVRFSLPILSARPRFHHRQVRSKSRHRKRLGGGFFFSLPVVMG